MQSASRLALSALVLICAAQTSSAQTATQTVAYEVAAISEMSMQGSPSLVVNSAIAGSAPTAATASGTYAITTNETNRKITAEIDENMPSGVTLTASLAAPNGATSAGTVVLTTSAQDVVTGIAPVSASGLAVSYGLSATAAAGVVEAGSKTVTYTIVAGA